MTTEWTKEDMDEAEQIYMRERPRGYPARGVLNELMTFAAERALQSRDAEIAQLKAEREEFRREAVDAIKAMISVVEVLTGNSKEPAIDAARRVVADRDALRAEFERLKPSGQVAEDRALIDKVMGFSTYDAPLGAGLAALSRLTAWAQAAHVLAEVLLESGTHYPQIGWHTPMCSIEGAGINKPCTEQCSARRAAISLVRNP